EIEEGNRENRMFQFAFEVNMNSISENYRTEKIVRALTESVVNNLDKNEYSYKLYRDGRYLVYENQELRLENGLIEKLTDADCVYQVLENDGKKYLIFICKSVIGGRNYYLESAKDITDLYEERNSFYSQYRVIMLCLVAVTGVVIFIVSRFLTRSVASLSDTTKRFAAGDYGTRAEVYSEDEIGTLAQDFNIMADNLIQKMDELKDNARKQEDFTASFAHELKTPLTSIVGYADMLRTMDLDKEETVEAANYIYSQGKRLESLSFKLLDLIVTQNEKISYTPHSARMLIAEAERITAKSLSDKEITLYTDVEEGTVYGEKDLLLSLFVNLVDNARKALSPKGKITITGRTEEEGYRFDVCDNGCGMPEEELHKVTEAFYMVDKSRSRKEGGAGLGLTLCSRIVALHKAEWKIESKMGEGTCITLTFPGKEVLHETEK
ncbi:MAG: HAMP domain-containing sensor histidine kinase, partial [Lachnospiraceae bacterium]|nr:HAMP domain-containing sensor histidine kinase [Lachnospiraceae bacterium]